MRRLGLRLAVLAALVAPGALRAQSIPVSVGAELTGLVGQSMDAPVVVDMTARSERLGSFAARMSWDPAVLRFGTSFPGSFGAVTVNADSSAQGVVRLVGANPGGAAGAVTLGTLRFEVLSAASTPLTVQLSELYAAGTFADLLPSAAVTSGSFCAARGRYGDVDRDGNANSRDALLALSNAVGLDVSAYDINLGDVDASGATNARDALIILSNAVGLSVSGYRVLALAGGACTLGAAATLVIAPGVIGDVMVGQTLQFEARAQSAGGLQAVQNVSWVSSNNDIMGVLGNGAAVARAPGTVQIAAVRDGRDTARVSVQVVTRRTLHVVATGHPDEPNQLGTSALPFRTIGDAVGVAQAGDTILVRPGRYPETVNLAASVLLLGDTLPDGTRPVIANPSTTNPYGGGGLYLTGSGSRRVVHIGFEDLYAAIDVSGPSRLELEGVRTRNVGNGVLFGQDISSIIVRRSTLLGTTSFGVYGSALGANAVTVDSVLVEDTEIGEFGNYGIGLGRFGDVAVLRSRIRDVPDAIRGGTGDTVSGRSGNVLVQQSQILRADYSWLTLYAVGAVRSRENLFTGGDCDCINVSGARWISSVGDSVDTQNQSYDWIYAYNVDSIAFDSLRAAIYNADGYFDNVPNLRVTRSRFHNVSGSAFDVGFEYGGPTGGRLVVDSVSITGDPGCSRCGTGFYLEGMRTTVDRFQGINLYHGLETYDSSLTVSRSLFRNAEYPIEWGGAWHSNAASLSVTNSRFEANADIAVYAWDGPMVVDSNTFVGGSGAMQLEGPWAMSVTRNRIDVGSSGIKIYPYDSATTTTITDNVVRITDQYGDGIYVEGDLSIQQRLVVQRDSVTCVSAYQTNGLYAKGVHVRATDNVVQGCENGLYLYTWYGGTEEYVRTDTLVNNTVVMPASARSAITAYGYLRSVVRRNTITGPTNGNVADGAVYANGPYCYGQCLASAIVDSNTIDGVANVGVRVANLDTATVAANLIQNVDSTPGFLWIWQGAIRLEQVLGVGTVRGNRVRQSKVYGLASITAQGTVVIDSNRFDTTRVGLRFEHSSSQAFVDVTRNEVHGSTEYGLDQASYSSTPLSVRYNNFGGNRFGAWNESGDMSLNVSANWWGDVAGPRCNAAYASQTCLGTTGDSVGSYYFYYYGGEGPDITFTPVLTAPHSGPVPLGAAPADVIASSRVVQSGAAAPAEPVGARPARLKAPERPRATARQPHPRRQAPAVERTQVSNRASAVPSGLDPAQARILGEREARQQQALAAEARQAESRASELEIREAERAAAAQAREERRRQREQVRGRRP